MKTLTSCLDGCGRTYDRPKSMPLCKAANVRAWAVCRALYGDADLCERARINARFWVDPKTITAALRGDLAVVRRRVAARTHNLYANIDVAVAS